MTDPADKHHDQESLHVMPGVSVDTGRVVPPKAKRRPLTVEQHVAGVREGNRAIIGRTFSLVESTNPAHRQKAGDILERLLPYTGASIRLGITGVPGVGKSTFIEALGMHLVGEGHRVAVLTVDPSSQVSGGSILGDKTRMEELARCPEALIRPSASSGWLGGVARGTREAILVCEAAGYDVVLVETVGVGQSETQVASMVDTFLLLMLAGAGDELQGMKRGVMEVADAIVINKADGDNVGPAKVAAQKYRNALMLLRPQLEGWEPQVLTCSSTTGAGIPQVWQLIADHRAKLESSGELDRKRIRQTLNWLHQLVEFLLVEDFRGRPEVRRRYETLERDVVEGRRTASQAAEELVSVYTNTPQASKEEQP